MRALTLLFFSASRFFLLQASSAPHSGYTSLVKRRFLPSGEKSTPPASEERLVACRASPPSLSINQICEDPLRSEIYAIRLESGDQRARWLASPSCVIWRGTPPGVPAGPGAIQICDGFLLAAKSTVCTVNVTHLPSGEICGSLIRFNSIMAAKSKGFFCAKTIAVEASVRMSQRRIHDDCSAPRLYCYPSHSSRAATNCGAGFQPAADCQSAGPPLDAPAANAENRQRCLRLAAMRGSLASCVRPRGYPAA